MLGHDSTVTLIALLMLIKTDAVINGNIMHNYVKGVGITTGSPLVENEISRNTSFIEKTPFTLDEFLNEKFSPLTFNGSWCSGKVNIQFIIQNIQIFPNFRIFKAYPAQCTTEHFYISVFY